MFSNIPKRVKIFINIAKYHSDKLINDSSL